MYILILNGIRWDKGKLFSNNFHQILIRAMDRQKNNLQNALKAIMNGLWCHLVSPMPLLHFTPWSMLCSNHIYENSCSFSLIIYWFIVLPSTNTCKIFGISTAITH